MMRRVIKFPDTLYRIPYRILRSYNTCSTLPSIVFQVIYTYIYIFMISIIFENIDSNFCTGADQFHSDEKRILEGFFFPPQHSFLLTSNEQKLLSPSITLRLHLLRWAAGRIRLEKFFICIWWRSRLQSHWMRQENCQIVIVARVWNKVDYEITSARPTPVNCFGVRILEMKRLEVSRSRHQEAFSRLNKVEEEFR